MLLVSVQGNSLIAIICLREEMSWVPAPFPYKGINWLCLYCAVLGRWYRFSGLWFSVWRHQTRMNANSWGLGMKNHPGVSAKSFRACGDFLFWYSGGVFQKKKKKNLNNCFELKNMWINFALGNPSLRWTMLPLNSYIHLLKDKIIFLKPVSDCGTAQRARWVWESQPLL